MSAADRTIPKEVLDLSAATTLEDLRVAADRLMAELRLGGYKFCVASVKASRLTVLAVISGGDLAVAETVLAGEHLADPEEPLARTYWTQQNVLWSEYLTERPARPAPRQTAHPDLGAGSDPRSGPRCRLEALGVTCGASIPVISRSGRKRASLCVSGAKEERAAAFDQRFPQLAPALRISGLAMFEFGLEVARQRAAQRLTPSEADVLELLAAGHRPREIATALSKSENTVRNQIAAARDKLGAESALQAVAMWTMRAP